MFKKRDLNFSLGLTLRVKTIKRKICELLKLLKIYILKCLNIEKKTYKTTQTF